jgi:hypothetical protein
MPKIFLFPETLHTITATCRDKIEAIAHKRGNTYGS